VFKIVFILCCTLLLEINDKVVAIVEEHIIVSSYFIKYPVTRKMFRKIVLILITSSSTLIIYTLSCSCEN
jgi:hypothetical protein